MSQNGSQPDSRLPRWLVWLGSAAIVFHLGTVGVSMLAAQSGPWADNNGRPTSPPFLASRIHEAFGADYLKPIRMNLNYHVLANRLPATPGVYLEFRLKDATGSDLGTVRVPDETASPWVRHRQSLLLDIFTEDVQVLPPQSEVIAAPGREVPTVQFWEMEKGQLRLRTVDINQVPRDRPVYGPTRWMFLFAHSYTRYLCHVHGAAKSEILRHHQDAIRPYVLDAETVPAGQFQEVTSNFGEYVP
ncbi:MAG TPA: hypothetical protein VKE94_01490 [Gemmataceae bacterium]|nr:hypothetical protein [Gemmataceae bacterium]